MELQKGKSQRQIPKSKQITSNKDYMDILYGYLQTICVIQRDLTKFIPKEKVKFTKIAKDLDLTRQTVSVKFKKLIDLGLVEQIDNGYTLKTLEKTDAFLLSPELLRILVNTLRQKAISVYIYLLNRFYANKEQPYEFNLDKIKEYVGMAINTKGNNYIITDILDILSRLKLISYELTTKRETNGTITSHYILNNAINYLPSC